jgi:hypothetical protein
MATHKFPETMQFKVFIYLYVSKCTCADFIQDMQGGKKITLNLLTSEIKVFRNEMPCSLVNGYLSTKLQGITSNNTVILTLTT